MKGRGESGVVSVYFIMITAAFVLFAGVMIDYGRLAAFRKQAELTAKAGARSIMSSFDPSMRSRYGLFIRGGEDAAELFRLTAEGADSSETERAFRFISVNWKDIEVTESRPLADHGVFIRQVLEEMKYKAPVNLTLELLSRFRGLSSAVKDAGATVEVLDRMRIAYDKRESALHAAFQAQSEAGAKMTEACSTIFPVHDEGLAKDEAEKLAKSIGESVATAWTGTQALMGTAFRKLTEANESDDEIGRLSAEAAAKQTPSPMQVGSAEEAGDPYGGGKSDSFPGSDTASALAEVRASTASLSLGSAYFSAYRAELDTGLAQGAALQDAMIRLSVLLAAFATSADEQATFPDSGASEAQGVCSLYGAAYGSSPEGSVVAARGRLLRAQRSADGRRAEEEAKATQARQAAGSWMSKINAITATSETKEQFAALRKLAAANLDWNKQQDQISSTPASTDDSYGERDAAFQATSGWLDGLASGLEAGRDEIFMGEYVYERFSRFEPAYVRESMSSGSNTSLSLSRMETEFVLYGLTEPAANIAAAYGELFAFRLAIRTLEGLVECRGLGHPLVILAGALAYGFTNALADMQRLVQSGNVPLSKYVKANTFYEDYIRFFLLAHGGEASRTARMIALIEHNLGLSLERAYTYASGEGTASLDLLFYPAALRLFGRQGTLGGVIRGNRYEAVFAADASYE